MIRSTAANLPLHVPARASVARSAHFAGTMPVSKLPRLAEALSGAEGELQADFRAGPDAGGAPHLTGTISGEVELVCQRCLRPFRQALRISVDLRLVENEADEERLLHECEPYQVVDDRLPLHDLIEDEILLALPLSPKCGQADCAPVSRP